ncbi:hypothetical protein G647_04106 [Cladophialophora carrionii CBS 160.54]|uniref:Velvet domain-containing protein n=1 Tax=Cladophialophora carrionii CBS 160.54 TaxID=1279043 RepID=V9DDG1_9EURO|nr:uncharacterized protein G647_04106 [Cladophialophora carrionii CBS 160.54]ETI24736.1 hypothetical protein G647_04106 [Cladophialophora carrionii CBS 160.54]
MELAVAPPPRVAVGVRLCTPLVVTFKGSSTAKDQRQEDPKERTLPDLSGIWVYLSLTTADMEKSLAPPRENLFCGKRADSVHPVYHEQEVDRPTIAYAIFPDLVIKEPGSYRVRVSIIDMNGYALARPPI